MNRTLIAAVIAGLLAVGGGAAWWVWQGRAPAPIAQQRPAPAPPPAAPAPAADPAPATRDPSEPPVPAEPPAPATTADVDALLAGLFGKRSVLSLFQTDDFARRVAATVDNLGRSHASPRLWPVNPAPGRFLVGRQGDAEVIRDDNAQRYAAYVQLVESVEPARVVEAYRAFYPQLQQAYKELGYPGQSFHARLLAVLDQLIATPALDAPARVQLPEIHSDTPPQRPWVLYQFEDPALQSLSAGQRMLLRTGPDNARRLKVRLADLRRALAAEPAK